MARDQTFPRPPPFIELKRSGEYELSTAGIKVCEVTRPFLKFLLRETLTSFNSVAATPYAILRFN
jgi:hypothetical protein